MTDILNLFGYKVIEEDIHFNDTHMKIPVKTAFPPTNCPKCQSLDFAKHGVRNPIYLDTPISGKQVGIQVIRQRYRCRFCGNVFVDPLFGMDENHNMTSRLVRYIQTESLKRTFTSISEDVGADERVIRNIFKAYLLAKAESYKPETPEWLGIDEIHLLGNPRCVLTNVKERTLLDMLKTRTKPVVVDYLLKMPNRQRIQVVTMDMWSPYREAVETTLQQAKIVVDRYHVVRMANKGLDDFRKALKAGMATGQRRQLMRDRYVLLKRKKDLKGSDPLILDTWLQNIPDLKVAYELKEVFCDIYELPTKQQAKDRYEVWLNTLTSNPAIECYFSELTTAMKNWREPIFNYFDFTITNAYTESINSLIKIANRIGRGYSFDVIRAKMLFNDDVIKRSNFRKGNLKMHQAGQQPQDTEATPYLGVPISTLTEMIEHHEL